MYRTILYAIGGILIMVGAAMLLPAIVSLIYGEWYSMVGFLMSAFFTGGIGLLFYFVLFKNASEPDQKHALLIAALGWLSIALLGAIPFLLIAHITPPEVMQGFLPPEADYTSSLLNFRNPLHAFFESMSGFTTTGLTMAVHEPSIGKGLLFYRSLSQWMGGAGFIVLVLAVLEHPGRGSALLYNSEARDVKLKTSVVATAKATWRIYLGLTLFLIVYLFVGTYLILPEYPLSENIFDSVNHAMTGQSTGGFSTLDDSIAGYNSIFMEQLYLLPMILGSFSIAFYFKVIYEKEFREFWRDIQTRFLISAFVIGSLILILLLKNAGVVPQPVREGTFQFISALSTTGWQTSAIVQWDPLSVVFIVTAAMVIGGASGATVGGIKVIRFLLIFKGLLWQLRKPFLPKKTINTVRFDHQKKLPEEMDKLLAQTGIFTLTYLLMIFISSGITSFYFGSDYSHNNAFFEAASAQGTVGLSTGITSPSMPVIVEVTYIIQMWAGRLEVIPVLVLIRALFVGRE